ncbi:hypothetical protein ACQPXH_25175 [Nocardia sp. CA-135953]|uniref:hypothetical protein n=1 Tax=Nocardia sp. CA-135953 TaxID=3239978 RepID=UPI003D969E25
MTSTPQRAENLLLDRNVGREGHHLGRSRGRAGRTPYIRWMRHFITLEGGMKARERQAITDKIARQSADNFPLLLIGTGSFIGEGFDCPPSTPSFWPHRSLSKSTSSNTSAVSPAPIPTRPLPPSMTTMTFSPP